MARVSLIDPADYPSLHDLAERIRKGRRGNVINVYKVLLHNPAPAESWVKHINTVRWGRGSMGGCARS